MKIHDDPKNQVTFKCDDCGETFDAAPTRVEDCERSHPYEYFGFCITCNVECAQVSWQIANFCSLARSTGPKTPRGKATATENLTNRSPDAIERIKFNAIKHGVYAKAALTFPAIPGKYPQCQNCDVDHDYCRTQPACIKKTELFMQHLIAFEKGDPSALNEVAGIRQAQLASIFSDMVATIAIDGVTTRAPKHFFSQDGKLHLANYEDPITGENVIIEDVKAHPLLKPMSEILSRNNYTMADMNMTPKVVEDNNIQMGNINVNESNKLTAEQYQEQNAQRLDMLREQIERGRQRTAQDPVLLEQKSDHE